MSAHSTNSADSNPTPGAGAALVIDPVCGMKVDPARAAATVSHAGRDYYFCCRHCAEKFSARPDHYLAPRPPQLVQLGGFGSLSTPADSGYESCASPMTETAPVAAPPGARVEYICPMCPEVLSDHPAACPVCGMALEPRTITLDDGPNPELVDMTRRFWLALLLGFPVFALAMAEMLPRNPFHEFSESLNGLQLILTAVVVGWCGWPFFVRGWASIRNGNPNMFTLIALGVGAATVYSVLAVVAPDLFPAGFRGHSGGVMPYFDTAMTVTVLVLLGQVLELKARGRTTQAIRSLLKLAPKTARRIDAHGTEVDVPIDDLRPGDLVRIRPGEKVPADAVVEEGHSAVDESMITGESLPIDKEPNSRVLAGTLNGNGALHVRVEHVGGDTLLAKIVRMVGEAQRSRAPIEKLVDGVARIFVPAVVAVSLLTVVSWAFWGSEARLAYGVICAVSVLVIACPCALGLATPMAVTVGIGRGAEAGVLFRNAEALEVLQRADVLVVDKTGTLTEGRPAVVTIEPMAGFADAEVLYWAASIERASEHPLAAAVVRAAAERQLSLGDVQNFQSIPGKGVTGTVAGRDVVFGNPALLVESQLQVTRWEDRIAELQSQGQTVMILAVDARVAGLIGVADQIKPSTPEAIRRLQADGLRIVMLTGDHHATAAVVAKELGIDEVIAGVLPDQKLQVVQRLQSAGHVVAMAGDGVNDAPALAQAHVGIAMGTGTDVALETAGITLVKGDLRGIVRARSLSRATVRNIRQNLFLAFVYNTASVPIAAGILYPFLGIMISPVWASVAMSFSSLSVVANALRLRIKTL
ncbi:MAG: heavy metal translocating P-type ATPase [Planctomycetes bacterium]|nr:heavy metal translocating P-type ATPase [Planctomycetota bacterium]